MAKCKFCGEPVKAAPVFHPFCWEQAVNKYAGEICDEYCKFPREIKALLGVRGRRAAADGRQ